MALGELLRDLRKDRGFTLAFVAKSLHIGTSTLGAYERGKRFPPYETLIQIADFYNVNVDYLLGRTRIRTSWDDLMKQIDINISIIDSLRSISKFSASGQKMVLEYILFTQEQEKQNKSYIK